MPEFTMPTGAKLSITPAAFEDVMELKGAIGSAIGKISLTQNFADLDMNIGSILSDSSLLSEIGDKIKSVAISKEVRASLFKCFARVTYNDLKLTRDLFDDPTKGEDLRKDYYTICMRVIEVNLKPFFELTFSGLKSLVPIQPSTQK